MFNRNNKVKIQAYLSHEFGSTDIRDIPWAQQLYPSPMKDNIPKWFSRQKPDREGNNSLITIKTCPSFINTMKVGHIVRNPAELRVEGQEGFEGTIHTNIFSELGERQASWHVEDQFGDRFPFPKGMIRASYKFMTPYTYRVSKPTNLIILPCWWDENNPQVSAIQGLIRLSPKRDLQLNINCYIREPKIGESYTIPYGAPLAQLIVVDIPDVKYEHNQSLIDDDQAKRHSSLPILKLMQGKAASSMQNIKEFLIRTRNRDEN